MVLNIQSMSKKQSGMYKRINTNQNLLLRNNSMKCKWCRWPCPVGKWEGKAAHIVVNRSDRSTKYSPEATGTSLFLFPTLQGWQKRKKKVTEHERLWAFGYWHILMQLCFSQSSRYYLHSEAVCFFKSLCSRYECVVRRLWIMDEGVKGKVGVGVFMHGVLHETGNHGDNCCCIFYMHIHTQHTHTHACF